MHRRTPWIVSFLSLSLFATTALAQPRQEAPPAHQQNPPNRDNRDNHDNRPPGTPPLPIQAPGPPGGAFGPPPNHKESDAEARARAEHEKQLAAQDAERERTRADRQQKARDAELARVRAIPPSPALTEELTRYAQRKADLERIKQVATLQGRADASKRCDDLLGKEEQRHAAWIAAHRS